MTPDPRVIAQASDVDTLAARVETLESADRLRDALLATLTSDVLALVARTAVLESIVGAMEAVQLQGATLVNDMAQLAIKRRDEMKALSAEVACLKTALAEMLAWRCGLPESRAAARTCAKCRTWHGVNEECRVVEVPPIEL